MSPRRFLGVALLSGLVAGSASSADERPARVFHIGIVHGGLRSWPENVAFEDRLRELGYVEGRNLRSISSGAMTQTAWWRRSASLLSAASM